MLIDKYTVNILVTYRGYEGGTQGIIDVPDRLQNT